MLGGQDDFLTLPGGAPTGSRPAVENDFGFYPEEVAAIPKVAILKAAR